MAAGDWWVWGIMSAESGITVPVIQLYLSRDFVYSMYRVTLSFRQHLHVWDSGCVQEGIQSCCLLFVEGGRQIDSRCLLWGYITDDEPNSKDCSGKDILDVLILCPKVYFLKPR